MSAITAAPPQPTRLSGTRPLLRMVRAEWERTLAWTLAVSAAVLLFVGYRQLAASPFAAVEVAHLITGGVAALALLVASVSLLLTADLRDEADKLDRIDARLGRVAAVGYRAGTRLACTGTVVVGAVLLVTGWARAAGTGDFDRSLSGLAVAVLGFGAVAAGAAGYSLAARRVVRRRIGVLVNAGCSGGDSPASQVGADSGREWTADGLARFHRRSCPALHSATGAPRLVEGPAARLEPCLLCHGED